jgi:haloalkane dehalogenase
MLQQKQLDPGIYSEMIDRGIYPETSQFLEMNIKGKKLHYHYLDQGPRDSELCFLFVHGNPTWSFYFRQYIRFFSEEYRTIAVDHIGCGLSSLSDEQLSLSDRRNHLKQLIETLDLRNIVLVAHDWGGAIGMSTATTISERFKAIILSNTGAFTSNLIPKRINICRNNPLGTFLVKTCNLFVRNATWMSRFKPLSDFLKQAYTWPYRPKKNRDAVMNFINDIPMHENVASYSEIKRVEQAIPQLKLPTLLLWGQKDFCFGPAFLEKFRQLMPHSEFHRFEQAGHFVLEDEQYHCLELMKHFIGRLS